MDEDEHASTDTKVEFHEEAEDTPMYRFVRDRKSPVGV